MADVNSAPTATERTPAADPVDAAPRLQPFQRSEALSLGVELELQLVNTHDYDLAPYSDEMLRLMSPEPVVAQQTGHEHQRCCCVVSERLVNHSLVRPQRAWQLPA